MFTRESEVREELCFVYRRELLDRFYLDDHRVVNNQVHPITAFQVYLFINDGQGFLLFNLEPELPEFECKARLIRRLQKTGPERPMDLYSRANNALGQ